MMSNFILIAQPILEFAYVGVVIRAIINKTINNNIYITIALAKVKAMMRCRCIGRTMSYKKVIDEQEIYCLSNKNKPT